MLNSVRVYYTRNKYIILIILSFVLLLSLNQWGVFIDEMDNVLGAISVSKGGVIYKDYYSQHTPLMYYIMVPVAMLGTTNISIFRVYIALIHLAVWIFCYCRYKAVLGKMSLCLYPLFYVLLTYETFANMVLSDSIQALSLVVLLFETLLYLECKAMNIKNVIVYSVTIFISVGVAFVSVYPIFFILLLPMAYELLRYKTTANKKQLFSFHLQSLGIILLPFLLITLYFLANGALGKAIYQSYTFNREIYSLYQPGGLGASALRPFYDVFHTALSHLIIGIQPDFNARYFLYQTLLILGIVAIGQEKKWNGLQVCLICLFIIFSGIRGFAGFHSMPYQMVSSFIVCYGLQSALKSRKFCYLSLTFASIYSVMVLINLLPCMENSFRYIANRQTVFSAGHREDIVRSITDEDDEIWIGTIDQTLMYLTTGRDKAARLYCLVPWFADVYSEDVIEDLQITQPKYIYFNKNAQVWGYSMGDSAADVCAYIDEHYTAMVRDDASFIRNDYYAEAFDRLKDEHVIDEGYPQHIVFEAQPIDKAPLAALNEGRVFSEVFQPKSETVKYIDVLFGTYQRINTCTVEAVLYEAESNQEITRRSVSGKEIQDNEYYGFDFSEVNLDLSKEYRISFHSPDATGDNSVTIYATPVSSEDGYLEIDGQRSDGNMVIKISG